MKIANSDSIKDGELELIDALTGDLDWSKIEKLLREKHKLGLQDEVIYNSGDLVVHREKIAYRLDFDVKVKLSVLFDRDGKCISLSTSADINDPDMVLEDFSDNEYNNEISEDEPEMPVIVEDIEESDDDLVSDDLVTDFSAPDEINDLNNEDLVTDFDLNDNMDSENSDDLTYDEEDSRKENIDFSSEELDKQINELEEPTKDEGKTENISHMASQIAEMISEINER